MTNQKEQLPKTRVYSLKDIETAAQVRILEAMAAKYGVPGSLFPEVAIAALHEIDLLQGAETWPTV